MRKLVLALIALACMVPPAEAARRDERGTSVSRQAPAKAPAQTRSTQTQRPGATAPRTTQSTARQQPGSSRQQASRQQPTRQQASRSQTSRQPANRASARQAALQPGDVRASQGGILVRSASAATVSREAANCTRRNGRTVCGGRQVASRGSAAGWQSGLMPVDYAQRECPDGTFATLARGHENVVRCMPI